MQRSLSHYKFAPEKSEGQFQSCFSQTWPGGGFYGVISLESTVPDIEKIGKLLQETSIDLVMNSVEQNRIKLIKEVLNGIQESFFRVSEEKKDSSLKLALLLTIENAIYIGILGQAQCYIHRNGKTLSLSKTISGEKLPVFSGQLEEKDLVLITVDSEERIESEFKNSLSRFSEKAGYILGSESEIEKLVEYLESDQEAGENDPESSVEVFEKDDQQDENTEVAVEEEDFEVKDEVPKETVVDNSLYKAGDPDGDNANLIKDKLNIAKGLISSGCEKMSPVFKKITKLIVEKLGNIVTWIYETIVGSGKKVGRYKMPGDNSMKNRRILLLFVMGILILGLYFSVNWIKARNYANEQREAYVGLYSQIEEILYDAETKSTYSQVEASEMLADARGKIDQLEQYEVDSNESNVLRSQAMDLQDEIESRVRLEDPDVIADIKISYETADPNDIVFFNNALYLTDSEAHAVYMIDEQNEVFQVLGSSDGLRKPMFIEAVGDSMYIYDEEEGMFAYSPEAEDKVRKVTGLSSSTLGNVTEISSFDGSLYFLISDEGKIFKSSPAGSGFSYPFVRLEDDSFRSAKDLEINGLIYTLGNGELVRFYVDTKDSQITIDGVVPEIVAGDKFDLLASLKLLILDNENKRLVVLNQPEGNSSIFKLDKQYTVNEAEDRYFNDLREVTIDPATNTVYILDGFRVIRVILDE